MSMTEQDGPLRTVDEKIAARTQEIERRIDPSATQSLTAGAEFGGVRIENMLQVMEMARLMSVSQQAVPAHLRANPGMCLAICLQAVEWKMSCFAVANKSYVTNDRLNYESQLVHAVIEARAPLKERLKVRYEGEGDDTVCIVSGIFRGETEPREHRSPKLREVIPPKNDRGQIKGSPLWTKKPLVQLFYDTSRDWIRIYAPDVLLGIYTPDELEQYDVGADARDVTGAGQTLAERLAAQSGNGAPAEGFRDGVVEAGLNGDLDHGHAGAEAGAGAAAETGGDGTKKTRTRGKGARAKAADAPQAEPEPKTVDESVEQRMDDARAEPPADPVAKATAAVAEANAQATPLPKNPSQYAAWFYAWLPDMGSKEDIDDRWGAERNMRNRIGVTAEDREPLEAAKAKRIAEVPKRNDDE